MRRWKYLGIPIALLVVACAGDSGEETAAEAQPERTGSPAMAEGPPEISGDEVETASGLRYIIIEEGDGPKPEQGERILAHYTGWLTNGQKFDSSVDRGQPFAFEVGLGNVIAGWDEGLMMMKVGGKRRLIIPPELGYGERGAGGGAIPPGATLIFDVELVDIPGRAE